MHKISRIQACLVLMLILGLTRTFAQQQKQQPSQYRQEPDQLTAHKVTDNFYEVKGGSGANAGFIITKLEVLVIDAKMTEESAQEMLAAIKKITSKPITQVLITHSDGDHINGLAGFPDDIKIIAHANSWGHMASFLEKQKLENKTISGMAFRDELEIFSGKSTIKLLHFGPAHTDGDVIVYSPLDKTAFIGDLIFIGRDPLIHKHKNGNSFGLIKVLKKLLELDVENFLHGHGDMASRTDIQVFIDDLEEKQLKIAEMVKAGKSLTEVKEAFSVKDPAPQEGRSPRPSLVEIIYTEITESK
jgi:cyclase